MTFSIVFITKSLLHIQEEERLSKTDFTALLQIYTFHRSLVTCSALVVTHTYNEQTSANYSITTLLETFNIEVGSEELEFFNLINC